MRCDPDVKTKNWEGFMLNRRGFVSCAICAATTGLIATQVNAQAPGGLTRTILQKTEYPGDKYATIEVMAEIQPNFVVPRHTHPGVESAFVVEGGGTLSIKGQADRIVKAGDAFQVTPETPHGVKNGDAKMRLAITYVVEKDKPLATPAPE
jgi:quercetin dioxygenase-like cupin family protein